METGESLQLKGRKTRALIAYLALRPGRACPREELVGLLWGDRGEAQARSSLRQSLSEVRKALGDAGEAVLIAGRDTVALDAESISVDTVEFECLADEGTPTALERAAALYHGDLLEGLAIHDPAFEEWLGGERGRLRRRACAALTGLLDHQSGAGDIEAAVATAERLLALDPLQEAVHRTLMRLHVSCGERTLALKQYQACRDVLGTELGVEPEAETEQLADDIRTGEARTGEVVDPAPASHAPPAESLSLPDKPSIAVLPFVNMSGDADQEYFADGITEDIITELSRFRALIVIARNSSFYYKGRSPKVQDVGRELGVAYVVEGSVRKAGNRIRVVAQLVECESGNHVWAERYDRDLEDIFAVQDDLTRTVVSTIAGRIEAVGHRRARRMSADSLLAHDLVLRARSHTYAFTRPDNIEAQKLLARAIVLDPANARAHAAFSMSHMLDWFSHWEKEGDESLTESHRLAKMAVSLDDTDCYAQWSLGCTYLCRRRYRNSRFHLEKALDLNPYDVEARALYGLFLTYIGQPEEALAEYDQAKKVDPHHLTWLPWYYGFAFFTALRFKEAIEILESIEQPANEVRGLLAASYALVGWLEEANLMLGSFLRAAEDEMVDFPGRSVAAWMQSWHSVVPYKNDADREVWADGLRKAGLDP